jgi:hypothetical protein
VEYALSSDPEAKKRRSSRIVQSVPIIVEGTSALGHPFRERTSTVIINCHGCKYLSKHFVEEGNWVTLEIVQPEPAAEPRRVRAQVNWTYRPRSVQELFQIGVELETPGNIWGVAFPPEDWFPFPEPAAPEIPAATLNPGTAPAAPPAEGRPQLVAPPRAEAPQADMESAVRAVTARIVAQEASRMAQELTAQVQQAAQKAMEEASSTYGDRMIRRALERIEEARKLHASVLQQEWEAGLESTLRESRGRLATDLAQTTERLRESFAQQLAADLDGASARLEQIRAQMAELERAAGAQLGDARERLAALREEINETEAGVAENASAQMRALYESGQKVTGEIQASLTATAEQAQSWLDEIRQQIQDAAASARATMLARQKALEESIDALARRAQEARLAAEATLAETREQAAGLKGEIEPMVRGASETVDARLRELYQVSDGIVAQAQGTFAAFASEVEARVAGAREQVQAAVDAAGTAAAALQHEREALESRLDRCAEEILSETSAKLEELGREQSRVAESALAAQQAELRRMEQFAAQLREGFEQSVGRLAAAEQARLEETRRSVETLRGEIRATMESARGDWRQQLESDMAALGTDWNQMLHEAVRLAQGHLETRLGAAEQETIERIAAQAEARLAGQLHEAGRVAEELERATCAGRDAAREAEQRIHETGARVAGESAAALRQNAGQQLSEFEAAGRRMQADWLQDLDARGTDIVHSTYEAFYKAAEWYQKKAQTSMHTLLERVLEDAAAKLREQAGDVSSRFAGELHQQSQRFTGHSRALLEEITQEFVERGRQQVSAMREQTLAELENEVHRATAGALQELTERQERYREECATQATDALHHFGGRLASVSNEWVTASVQALHTRAQDTVEILARSTEQRVREAVAGVLAELGETLRSRLLGIAPPK